MSEAEIYDLVANHHIRGGDYYMQDMSPLRYVGSAVAGGAVAGYGTKRGAKKNPWLEYLKKIRKANPHLKANEVAKLAAKSYKKEGKKAPKRKAPKRKAPKRKRGGILYGGYLTEYDRHKLEKCLENIEEILEN